MIRQTAFAAAVDEHRSYLNGVLFEVEGERLQLVATDTNRLAFRRGKLPSRRRDRGRPSCRRGPRKNWPGLSRRRRKVPWRCC